MIYDVRDFFTALYDSAVILVAGVRDWALDLARGVLGDDDDIDPDYGAAA